MGTYVCGAKFPSRQAQGLLELGANLAAARSLAVEQLREVLRAEHMPDRVELPCRCPGLDAQSQRLRVLRSWARFNRRRKLTRGDIHIKDRGDCVPVPFAGYACRIGEQWSRHGKHITHPTMIKAYEWAMSRFAAMNEVAHRPDHRLPAQRDLACS